MIQSYAYHAENPGLHLLILGAVHGNEKCGTAAIHRVMKQLDSGELTLVSGRVTFVPICNPRAYAADVRFTERNLNRYLVPMAVPNSYEAELGNILCPLLADCDVLLDIHSYTVGGAPFSVVDQSATATERAYVASLGADVALYGWQQAYAATGRSQTTDPEEATGTTQYARRHGAMAVTLECGQHKDPQSDIVAYNAIHNAMRHLGLVEGEITIKQPQAVTMSHVYYRDDNGELAQPWENFGKVVKNELIATRANGEAITAPVDGIIIMPKAAAALGEEWFYFGTG